MQHSYSLCNVLDSLASQALSRDQAVNLGLQTSDHMQVGCLIFAATDAHAKGMESLIRACGAK